MESKSLRGVEAISMEARLIFQWKRSVLTGELTLEIGFESIVWAPWRLG